jgi:hypothetical protein
MMRINHNINRNPIKIETNNLLEIRAQNVLNVDALERTTIDMEICTFAVNVHKAGIPDDNE